MDLEQITAHFDPDEGWQDIFLSIINTSLKEDSFEFVGKGLYGGDVVGLKIEINNGMAAGLLPDGEINTQAFYKGTLSLSSIGKESDLLLHALGVLYGVSVTGSFKGILNDAVVFSLNDTPPDFEKKGYYKFKLFFHDDSESDYCEMYCNIDTIRGIIELNEKDQEYRGNILKAFTSRKEDIR